MSTDLKHDESKQHYFLIMEGHRAYVEYKYRDGKMYLVHSEVPFQHRGRGMGKKVVHATLDYLEENNIKATPTCGFIRYMAHQRSLTRDLTDQ